MARKLRRSVGLDERDGVLVRTVADDSPAAAADLRTGDLIVGAGGRPVASVEDLHSVLAAHDTATSLELAVVRGAEALELTVAFG